MMVERGDPTELPLHRWTQERLSAYVDNDLSPAERDRVEVHLAECQRCASDVETLRQTVVWLRQLPTRTAPRSFALSPAHTTTRARVAWLFPYFSAAGVLAAVLLLVVLAGDFLQTSGAVRMAAAPVENRIGRVGAPPPVGPTATGTPPVFLQAQTPGLTPSHGNLNETLGAAAPDHTLAPTVPAKDTARREFETQTMTKGAGAAALPTATTTPPAVATVSPPAAAVGEAAPVAPAAPLLALPRKPAAGAMALQQDKAARDAAAPSATPLLTPATPMASPTAPLSTPTTSTMITGTVPPSSLPKIAALAPQAPTRAPAPPSTAGATTVQLSFRWVWRTLEVGLLLAMVSFLAGAWWVRHRGPY
jgi:hypothetical protein